MKIDMANLKSDMKTLARSCAETKRDYREACRTLSNYLKMPDKDRIWQDTVNLTIEIAKRHAAHQNAAFNMTALCVFRASLRGKKHLTANHIYNERVEQWVADYTDLYSVQDHASA